METSSRSSHFVASTAVLLALVLLVTLPFALTACGGTGAGSGNTTSTQPGAPSGSSGDDVVVAMSDVTRLTPAASQTDILSAADSLQLFGADLYGILAAGAGEGNLVFSPSSIVTALAMTYAGAASITAEEMAATLHFTLEGDALHQAFNSLDTTLESRTWKQKNAEGKEEGVLLKTANSLWAQRDLAFEKSFLDTLAANYGAGIRLCDFGTAAEEARQAINEWVAAETNDKIPELIPKDILSAMSRLVLVNAVYLDATWAVQFDPALTRDGPFTTLAGGTVTTPMMNQTALFPYASGDGWQAVELPYLGNELAMLLIVPDEGRFSEIEGGLTAGLIDETVAALSKATEVNLTMPKFEFRTQAGLNEALMSLGMKSAFGAADFSGMTTQADLFISAVVHEAFIAVDEEGTEAAAATAVVMGESAQVSPPDLVTLTIDRPFLFALQDRETGALLFLGRVADPTA